MQETEPFGKAKDDSSRKEKCGSSPRLKAGVPAARNYDGNIDGRDGAEHSVFDGCRLIYQSSDVVYDADCVI